MRSFLLLMVASCWFALAAARPITAEEKKKPALDSPQAVFAAVQQAQQDQDLAQIFRCSSKDRRDILIAGLLFPVEPRRGQKSQVDQFMDREALRKRLREVIPVSNAEAVLAVKGLVKDPEAAFIACMEAQTALEKEREKERAARQKEQPAVDLNTDKKPADDKLPTLTKVKIDGDRAEGILQRPGDASDDEEVEEKDLPKVHFVKEDGEWRTDLGHETRKKLLGGEEGLKYQSWQELPAPRCKTPEEAFAYEERAYVERNPAAVWVISSPLRREGVMEGNFWQFWERGGNGSLAAAICVDLTALKDAQLHNSTGNLLECVRDKPAYFCSIVKWGWQAVEHYDNENEQQRKGKLRNVKIDGNRARGEETQVFVAKAVRIDGGRNEEVYRSETEDVKPRYFTLTDEGWLLDAPTKEESERDFEEWKKAFDKRNAEREAKEKEKNKEE